ncbi:MAG: tetratricopeptide repeat protein, partial [Nitrospirota bacterium]|nr:tetratricopeptide repeat protein [Nitrospirota bacterium]
ETVHLRIIVVTSEKDAGEILSEIKNGKPFAFLAKEISLDEKSRDEYGYLGKVAVNKLEAPLREAASRLKDGEISGAIKLTDNRYAIIQIVELRYYTKGAKAFREKDFKTAEINLLKHIELNPDAAKARVMLGEIYENREETEKAIEMYKEALSFDPKHNKAYEQLGKAYLYLGQHEKAKEIYEEGLKHIPDALSLWKGLKTAKMKMSQK